MPADEASLPALGVGKLVSAAWQAFSAGQPDEALRRAQAAHQIGSHHPSAAAAVGYFLFVAGDLDGAQSMLDTALLASPHHAPLHWYKGLVLRQRGNLAEAAAALRRACLANPALDEAAEALAWVLHDLKDYAEALTWARAALAKRASADRHFVVGWLHQRLGAFAEALTQYRIAETEMPQDAPARPRLLLHLAQVLGIEGRMADAKAYLAKALLCGAGQPRVQAQAGWWLRDQQELDAAFRIAHDLVARDAGFAPGWHLLGDLHMQRGDLAAADHALGRCQDLDFSLTDALWCRAQVAERLGRTQDAEWLAEKVFAQDPR
jgi:tetratricopeptide (TPR) repeat protein